MDKELSGRRLPFVHASAELVEHKAITNDKTERMKAQKQEQGHEMGGDMRNGQHPSSDSDVEAGLGAGLDGTQAGVIVDQGDGTPDGGYGWVIVGCMMGQNAVTWGE